MYDTRPVPARQTSFGDRPAGGRVERRSAIALGCSRLQRGATPWNTYDATPIEETLEALNDVVRAGKARYIGASSMYAWQFAKALYLSDLHGWPRFVSMQDHYNLVYREEEREMIPLCIDQGIGLIPWSPLARGFLAGNRSPAKSGETTRSKSDEFAHRLYYQPEDFAIVDRAAEVGKAIGKSSAQVAVAWLLSKPFVTSPIFGASKPEHLEQARESITLKLTDEQVAYLEAPYKPHPTAGL